MSVTGKAKAIARPLTVSFFRCRRKDSFHPLKNMTSVGLREQVKWEGPSWVTGIASQEDTNSLDSKWDGGKRFYKILTLLLSDEHEGIMF